MMLLGLDLNATRVLALSGLAEEPPLPVPLDPPALALPMVLNLESYPPKVGHAGARYCRLKPHLVCQGFLPFIHEDPPQHQWLVGRQSLTSVQALGWVLHHLFPVCQAAAGVAMVLPGYFSTAQIEIVTELAHTVGLPLTGTLPSPLAMALGAYAERPWFGLAIVLEADDHAVTLSTVHLTEGKAKLLETRSFAHLGIRLWKERLLNSLADRCVVQSRRDPRDSPAAEQMMFDQVDGLFEACRLGRTVQVAFHDTGWYQCLVVSPDQALSACAALHHQLMAEVDGLWQGAWPDGSPGVILLSAAAGRLPGIIAALQCRLDDWSPLSADAFAKHDEDFGEDLMEGPTAGPALVVVAEDAPARVAHELAAFFQCGQLPPEHIEQAPLPLPHPQDAGPARLHFKGQDYFVNDANFLVGSLPGCHLVFAADDNHGISPRHCEIVLEHRRFRLFDRSRLGTLVNDRPVAGSVVLHAGDWIRLGPDGPLLRFMGGAPDRAALPA